MERKTFLKMAALATITGAAFKLKALEQIIGPEEDDFTMPALFVGHGNPMNAIEENRFSAEMKAMGAKVPVPSAILMVSAHWETRGTFVTAQEKPRTIHDFGGFPKALFEKQYPAPGSPWLAEETRKAVTTTHVEPDHSWGFDHGCWSVTANMFPKADIPIIQLSLDYTQPPAYHYELAQQLAKLRKKGVLIIGSGNIVHNLQLVRLKGTDFNEPFAFDWAVEANEKVKQLITSGDHAQLANYSTLGKALNLAIPTPEHYLPLLYTLALQQPKEGLSFFNDEYVGGSLSMTSVLLDGKLV